MRLNVVQYTIGDLTKDDATDEWSAARLLAPVLEGVLVHKLGLLRLVKHNVPTTASDNEARYLPDFRWELEGQVIGYLDPETKRKWTDGDFPYAWVNVAEHPLAHWKAGHFTGRRTNKLLSFESRPGTSHWLAVRRDGAAVVPLLATQVLAAAKFDQRTEYDPIPLPVRRVAYSETRTYHDPAELRDYFLTSMGFHAA